MEKSINPEALVDEIVSQAVSQPTADEQGRMERRSMLASMRVASTTEVEPEVSALTVDDVGLFALSDIHGLKGKQKCGKTTALKVCLAAWMQGSQFRVKSGLEEPRVLYLDTEQKQSDVKLIVTDVIQMTSLPAEYVDAHLQVYALRRRQIIEQHRAELQQKRQQAVADKQKERLDYTLQVIRDYGGSISRKQLTEILVKKFENRRQTISGFISQWIKDKSLFEMNAVISDSDKMYFGL